MKLGIIRGYDEAAFEYVKNMGLDFIECCRNSRADAIDFVEKVASTKANIAKYGIPIQSVGRWNPLVNIGGKLEEEEMKSMTDLLDAAIEVGSPVFVCGINYADDISLYKNYCTAVEYFGTLIERAKASGSGIKVAVYNCDWGNFVHRDEVWKVVLGELPDLWIKYDCSHAYSRGQDYLSELSDWGHRVAHFHIKGTVKTKTGRRVDDPPAGMDDLDWGSIFAILYARKYAGGLSIEPHSATWRADSELGQKGIEYAINFTRRFML